MYKDRLKGRKIWLPNMLLVSKWIHLVVLFKCHPSPFSLEISSKLDKKIEIKKKIMKLFLDEI